MKIPAGAGSGKAKMTFSYPGSSEGLFLNKSYEFELLEKGKEE